MFLEDVLQEDQVVDGIETEAVQADDVEVAGSNQQQMTFSNGVVFTPEELATMDPEVVKKLQQVKTTEVNLTNGIVKLKNAKPKPAPVQPVATPDAPEAPGKVEFDPVRHYSLKNMTKDNLLEAKQIAVAKYGEVVFGMIADQVGDVIKAVVDAGKFDYNFAAVFQNTFAELMANDVNAIQAFNQFKGISGEEVKAQAKADALKEIVEHKTDTSTGLPSGGNAVVNTPNVEAPAPTRWDAAKIEARKRFAELYKDE